MRRLLLQTRHARGISLIELLLVVSLILILGASTTPFLSQFVLRTQHDKTVNQVVGKLRKAQGYSMDSRNDSTWGVCLFGDTLRLYTGSCGTPTFSQDTELPVTVVNVSGLSDVTFSRRGEPSSSLSISITSEIESVQVTMNVAGGTNVFKL